MDLQIFFEEQDKLLKKTPLKYKRYIYDYIDWDLRLIGLLGARGLGKTTILLQYTKEHIKNDDILYLSLDSVQLQATDLFDLAKSFEQLGGKILILDEVHKYNNWSLYIKNIYDKLDLKIIFSGSSILQIYRQNGDLSRRAIMYRISNLSFREYLEFTDIYKFEKFNLEEILTNHKNISKKIIDNIKPLKYFKEYLQYGAYPFMLEGKDFYHQKIIQILNLILESDVPYIKNIEPRQINKLKKLLYLISQSVPFVPNFTKLAQSIDLSRPKIYEYIEILESANILNSIRAKEKGYKILSKPDKLYLSNTNLTYAITKRPDMGNLRETFFVNQVKNYFEILPSFIPYSMEISKKGDFLIDQKFTFDIGGAKKSFDQIKDLKDSYVVADDIEIGFKNKIPLWLFGFLY